jgi:hypothetical protein
LPKPVVADHFEGTRGSFTQAGWDVLTPDGKRIQVKALREVEGAKRRNLSPIRDREYDYVVIVVFDDDFVVTEGLKLDRDLVEELFDHRPYVNGRGITVTKALREHPAVEHLDLNKAARSLGTA